MELCYRSSVNRWECDENDHMNVRFYVAKHMETLHSWLMGSSEQPLSAVTVQAHHLRFLSESRLSAPLSGYAMNVAMNVAMDGTVLTELRQSVTGEVLSTCLHEIGRQADPAASADLPAHAQPRGVTAEMLQQVAQCSTRHEDCGFQLIGQGVAQSHEAGADANLSLHNYMARVSDSMPHLWASFGAFGEDDSDGLEGGAVLEYRFHYHQPIRAGQRFAIYSGLYQAGTKVQTFAHLIFNQSEGFLASTAVAAAVRMDLKTRRAKSMSEHVLARLKSMQLQLKE